MIEIKINNATFYRGFEIFKALTVFKRLESMGQQPSATGDERAMIRWEIIQANL